MSGDATEKPHFYNDIVHAGEETHEKWSEMFIRGHRHTVHIIDEP